MAEDIEKLSMFTAPRSVQDLHQEIWRSSHGKSGVIANSITQWLHYRDYLERVLERYEGANRTYLGVRSRLPLGASKAPGRRRLSRRASADWGRLWPLTRDVHLEIESFYVFGKILLDRVADTFALFFRGQLFGGLASSHRKLMRDQIVPICREKNIRPGKLPNMIQDLQRRVVDHRTQVIEHRREPRYSPGSHIGADRKIRIEMGLVSATDADHEFETRTTEAPADLMNALDDYLDEMAAFMRANRAKSVLASRQEDNR
jgi:hypothetical protein